MARLFVALLLPEEIKDELLKAQKAVRKLNQVEGNFIRRENLHLTLKFLGHIEEALIPPIIEILRLIKADPIELSLHHLGTFPQRNRIHVVWASVMSNALHTLAKDINNALIDLSPSEERAFQAHLTLVRVKKIRREAHFLESLQHIAMKPLSFFAHQFVLMESKLSHEGATYEVMERFEL
ncbi:MAG TPA: RNA 2',3'-cyclic phosphodiesterase [Myxococcota bacterium]|nr:RNA 2',3'-cyclic phosphodiesterase [Myxococcota bacterium]